MGSCLRTSEIKDTQLLPRNEQPKIGSDKLKLSNDGDSTKTFSVTDNIIRVKIKKKKIGLTVKPSSVSDGEMLKVILKANPKVEDLEDIDQSLSKHFFMRNIEQMQRYSIIQQMSLCSIEKGQTLFKQGSSGTYLYILKQGQMELLINENPVKSFQAWDSFGELALLHDALRSGTVLASTDSMLWCLDRKIFKGILNEYNNTNFAENKKLLDSVPILNSIEQGFKSMLCLNLILLKYEEGQEIVREGDTADCIYIIKEGTVVCSKSGQIIRQLTKGEFFGDKSILIQSQRTMDVFAKTRVICCSVSVETLKSVIGDTYKDTLYLNFIKYAMGNSPLLKVDPGMISRIYPAFTMKNYQKNEVCFSSNYVLNSKIVIIVEGNLKDSKTGKLLDAKRGDILFEQFLLISTDKECNTLGSSLIAEPDCMVLEAKMEDIKAILKCTFLDFMERSKIMEYLQKVSLFKTFTHTKLEAITSCIQIETFYRDDIIIKEGETGSKFYIVKKGKVDIYNNKGYIRTVNECEYFGEKSLFINEKRTATAIAKDISVELLVLSKEDFRKIICEENLHHFLLHRLTLQDDKAELKDLDMVKTLGHGNFGNVYLVCKRENKVMYALKAISKVQIENDQIEGNLEMERKILLQIDHPFIMKLVKCLKDDRHIYFLMEYILGKELFDVIRDIGLLNKEQTLFYGAGILLAIEYLHKRRILHRDIKPENIMVTPQGFIKIIDFGTAKEIKDKTSTVIGTPQYMSPEVIIGEGYSYSADFWSLAICLYEFMCGGVPHGEGAEDPMEIYNAIIYENLKFPKFMKDKEFISLMKQMLVKNPIKRLCSLNQIKANSWFANFDWDGLSNLNCKIPYVPVLKNNTQSETLQNLESFIEFSEKNVKPPTGRKKAMSDAYHKKFEEWYSQF